MSKIDVFWAEQQDVNYLLALIDAIHEDEEESKPRRLSNSELLSYVVDDEEVS